MFVPDGWLIMLCPLAPRRAQDKTELQQILERLDRLEQQNHKLADEVHALRTELAVARGQAIENQKGEKQQAEAQPAQTSPTGPASASAAPAAPAAALSAPEAASERTAPIDERVQVAEQRVADLSQEKVEASQRFPISLTGMVLFNSFLNGKNAAGDEDPSSRFRDPRARYERSHPRADGAGTALPEPESAVGRGGERLGILRFLRRDGHVASPNSTVAHRGHSTRLDEYQRDGGTG